MQEGREIYKIILKYCNFLTRFNIGCDVPKLIKEELAMKRYVILSEKTWNKDIVQKLEKRLEGENVVFELISSKQDFTIDKLCKKEINKIFIPHWSYIIPVEIYENYECVVFHMTDLPYGRGGSPLQNLITRGHTTTKISALKVVQELDAGPIYLKKDLSLLGSAEEIFIRSSRIIQEMIFEIICNDLSPKAQVGTPTVFKRRTPEMSNISSIDTLDQLYDHIRMLDAENYPKAFLETDNFRFEFNRASLKADKSIIADVRIFKK